LGLRTFIVVADLRLWTNKTLQLQTCGFGFQNFLNCGLAVAD